MAQGVSRLSVKIFLSHSAEKSSRGSLLCCVSETFRQSKSLWIRGGENFKSFRRKLLSDSAEKFRMGTLQCVIISSIENLSASECYVTIFYRNSLPDSDKKNLQGNPSVLCFRKLPAAIKFMHRRRGDGVRSIRTFCQKFFVSQCRKKQQRKPSMLCFRKFPLAKKFVDKRRWEYQDFPSNFFSHSAEKFSKVTFLCCVSENFRQ